MEKRKRKRRSEFDEEKLEMELLQDRGERRKILQDINALPHTRESIPGHTAYTRMAGILHPPPTTQELELLDFLNSDNWQVRQVALSNLAGFSTRGHQRRGLLLLDGTKEGQPDVVAALKRLSMDLTVSLERYRCWSPDCS